MGASFVWGRVMTRKSNLPAAVLSTVTSRKSMVLALAGYATEYLFKRRRKELEEMEAGFDSLEPYELGRGGAQVMAAWLAERNPDHTARQHAASVKRALKKLDEESATTLEMAMARFLASKIMLVVEGFRPENPDDPNPHYEIFQHQAREILRVFPQHKNVYRQDVFLGKPFSGESLLIFAQRMWSALIPRTADTEFDAFVFRYRGQLADLIESGEADTTDYLAQLMILTRMQNGPDQLTGALDEWFSRYQSFRLGQLKKREKLVYAGLGLAGGGWCRQVGGKIWNGIFNKRGVGNGQPAG